MLLWIIIALSAFVVVVGVVFKTVRTPGIQAQRSIQKVEAIVNACGHTFFNRFFNLNRSCNGLITNRKFGAPTASRWLWVGSRVHTRSSARAIDFWTRVYHATTHGHSAVQANRCTRRSTIGCHLVALPNQRAVTDKRVSACGQVTTTHAAELSSARTLR